MGIVIGSTAWNNILEQMKILGVNALI